MSFIHEKDEFAPFFKSLNDILGKIRTSNPSLFPDFSKAETVLSISDYSGEDNRTDYQTYSFFILDYNNAGVWNQKRINLRNEKLGIRNMEFKKLKDKLKLKILEDYLDMFDSVDGILATFAVHKSIKNIFGYDDPAKILKQENLGEYTSDVAEKFLRIIHFNALLVSGLTNSNHKFWWYSDQDSSMDKNIDSFIKLTGQIFDLYVPHKLGFFGFSRSFAENKNEPFDDLQSLSDLVAGAVIDYLTINSDESNELSNLREKVKIIMGWHRKEQSKLKKLIISLEEMNETTHKIVYRCWG